MIRNKYHRINYDFFNTNYLVHKVIFWDVCDIVCTYHAPKGSTWD